MFVRSVYFLLRVLAAITLLWYRNTYDTICTIPKEKNRNSPDLTILCTYTGGQLDSDIKI